MEVRELLNVLHIAERLKDELRHCETSKGRRESVAEHSWRLALMAFFMKDEFPTLNMDKVIKMCLIHDLGECFTGDIPTFMKSASDEKNEDTALFDWVASLPLPYDEAKLYKALDKLEAVIQHNESDIRSWEPLEYDLNRTYAYDAVAFSPYLTKLREAVREDTEEKIKAAEK